MHGGHAVHGQIVEVAQPHVLERVERVSLLGEEDVIGLDGVEGHHPQGIVGEKVEEEHVPAPLDPTDQPGCDGPALDDEHQRRLPLEADSFEPSEDPELIGGLGAAVLVEGVVAPVGEGTDLVTHGHELVPKVHSHVLRTLEGQHDEPAHAASLAQAPDRRSSREVESREILTPSRGARTVRMTGTIVTRTAPAPPREKGAS